jgi:DNA-binding transcriptional regulator LsrR (DeoR family)
VHSILGTELGAYISRTVTGHMTVGLGWGNTPTSAIPSITLRQVEGIRVVAVNPLELAGSRNIVLVSGGWHKYKSIKAALKLLKPSVAIVNEGVAERLVRKENGAH